MIYSLGKSFELSIGTSAVANGSGVYIFGKRLANNLILPKAVFKDFDFSQIEKGINRLKIKTILLTVFGISLIALSSYQIYNLWKLIKN